MCRPTFGLPHCISPLQRQFALPESIQIQSYSNCYLRSFSWKVQPMWKFVSLQIWLLPVCMVYADHLQAKVFTSMEWYDDLFEFPVCIFEVVIPEKNSVYIENLWPKKFHYVGFCFTSWMLVSMVDTEIPIAVGRKSILFSSVYTTTAAPPYIWQWYLAFKKTTCRYKHSSPQHFYIIYT